LRLSAIAISVLAIAPLVLIRFAFPTFSPSVRVLYVGIIVVGASLFVAAQYYKIVPFLVWNEYFGPLAGKRPLPRVAELYEASEAEVAVRLLGGGGVVLLTGLAIGVLWLVRLGAVLLTAGALVE